MIAQAETGQCAVSLEWVVCKGGRPYVGALLKFDLLYPTLELLEGDEVM